MDHLVSFATLTIDQQEGGRPQLVPADQGGFLEEGVFWAAKHVFGNFLSKGENW
jgi:hypothetical protein